MKLLIEMTVRLQAAPFQSKFSDFFFSAFFYKPLGCKQIHKPHQSL